MNATSFFSKILFFISAAIFLSACGNKNENPKPQQPINNTKTFELYLDYWNPTGQNPKIVFDAVQTSPEIIIDFSKNFDATILGSNFVDVNIDNVRIIDQDGVNYQIDTIHAFEYINNDWFKDLEFTMDFQPIQDMMVYLVLDVSASLGNDFGTVKNYASNFVNKIFNAVPNARVGVIDFATDVNIFNATNQKENVLSYIDDLQQGQFTSLYQAMDLGINFLQMGNAESKSLLTFTDGSDNNSDTTFNPQSLSNKLLNDPNTVKVVSYTLGLGGTVNKEILENLALNGGSSAFPASVQELETVFDDFSKTISTVYNLTYRRNQQIIPEANKRSLKFVLEANPR